MKCIYIFIFLSVVFSIPDKVYCLEALSKNEMKTTTGQRALTDFSVTENTARMFINTHIETYTTINSMKLGRYDSGWDQDWTELSLGTKTDNLKMDGFILKADFDNLSSTNPELKRLIIGTNRLQGTISGTFNSFTGTYNPVLTGETTSATSSRTELGEMSFEFKSETADQNQGFFLILSPKTANTSGIHAVMGYNESNIPNNYKEQWWDSP